jgi:hypothetical protein
MRDVFLGLAALACPVGMGVMMWVMGKGMRGGADKSPPSQTPTVAQLREEHGRLGAQLEQMERGDSNSLRRVS